MIIKLSDKNYSVKSDLLCWVLSRKRVVEKGKLEGQEVWEVEGYYPNLKSLSKALMEKVALSGDEIVTIKELSELLDSWSGRIEKVVAGGMRCE